MKGIVAGIKRDLDSGWFQWERCGWEERETVIIGREEMRRTRRN